MTRPVSSLTLADTFSAQMDRINTMANLFSSVVLTTASNTAGDSHTGNLSVNGTMRVTTFAANTIRGGNVTTSANLTLSSNVNMTGALLTLVSANVSSNVRVTGQVNTGSLVSGAITSNNTITANVISCSNLSTNNAVINNVSFNTLAIGGSQMLTFSNTNLGSNITSPQTMATLNIATYGRGFKFIVQSRSGNTYQLSESMVIAHNSEAMHTTYATVRVPEVSNSLGNTSVALSGNNLTVSFLQNQTATATKLFVISMGN